MKYCEEWKIPESRFPDYFTEKLKGDALIFIEDMIKDNPCLTWNKLSVFVAERYANVNREKEVSDRLLSLHSADSEISDEDPEIILERINDYIDKHTPIDLQYDQTDAVKARFL